MLGEERSPRNFRDRMASFLEPDLIAELDPKETSTEAEA